MSNMYHLENNSIYKSFLNNIFFKNWEKGSPNKNFENIELQITSKCNLGCKYCYYTHFGEELYPSSMCNEDNILTNLEAILLWLVDNKYVNVLNLFTGELFIQSIGRKCLDFIYNFYKKVPSELRPLSICIPTNYTWITNNELVEYVEKMIKDFNEIGIPIGLSASFDGLLESENRPYKNSEKKDLRNEEYADKIFEFNKRHGFGFHPMIYSNKIEKWKDNFLWFQEKFKQFNIPPHMIYLLEVRNEEWTDQQIKDFGEFIKFLVHYSWELTGKDLEKFKIFLFKESGFNIIGSPLSKCGRGLGCSLQSTLFVRLGDLTINPCHRLSYPQFLTGKFVKSEDNKIMDIECTNLEVAVSTITMDFATQPYCQSCLVAPCCTGGCLGSQYEATGDLFTPIPTVCQLEHQKVKSLAEALDEIGVLNQLCTEVNFDIANTLITIKNY